MALSYTGGTGLFTHLGKIIGRINSYTSFSSSTLAADQTALFNAFASLWLPTGGIASVYKNFQDGISTDRRTLAGFANARLTDPATVLTQFSAPLSGTAGVASVVPALQRQMVLDGQTVKASMVTVGAVTPLAGNAGNGTAFVTRELDGYNPPVQGAAANPLYTGWQSQMCAPAETMTLECVQDNSSGGLNSGSEIWQWTGGTSYPAMDWRPEGSGSGPTLYSDQGSGNLTFNGNFINWSGSLPVNWAAVGASGISRASAADKFLPDYTAGAVLFSGDGFTSMRLSQAVGNGLSGRRKYSATFAVKATGATSGTVRVGFLDGGSGYLDFPAASLGSTYQYLQVFHNVPSPVPNNYACGVSVVGLNDGASVWVGSASLAPTTYHGGVGVNLVAGSTPWQRGDRLTFTVANDQAGKFQDFFRAWYKAQLPSVYSGASQGTALTLPFLLLASQGAEGISDALVS
jgi:hypothetical protein